jgi:pyruvate kinase
VRRNRSVKVIATLGPASSSPEMIEKLFLAGADVFRINMSHTSHKLLEELHGAIRQVEQKLNRPIGILADLQGPKLRLGTFQAGEVRIAAGDTFTFDTDPAPGDATRVHLRHPEIFSAVKPGDNLLVNDGRLRVEITDVKPDRITTRVIFGGVMSDKKGLNLPDTILPIPALTEKDRADLDFAAHIGVDWIALSFVQRPEDVAEARKLIAGRAGVMAKIEKPSALNVAAGNPGDLRRHHGGARRSRGRIAARDRAGPPEADHPRGAPRRPPRRGGDPDARIDDRRAGADPRRGLRRRHRRL